MKRCACKLEDAIYRVCGLRDAFSGVIRTEADNIERKMPNLGLEESQESMRSGEAGQHWRGGHIWQHWFSESRQGA